MARNARSPTVPSQSSPTSTMSQSQSIPMIRVEKPMNGHLNSLEIVATPPSTTPQTDDESTLKPVVPVRIPRKPRQPRQTSIRSYRNSNGIMKGEQKDTVVNFGFTERPVVPTEYCCGKMKIQKGCRLVGIFSLIGFGINLILYFMGISKLGLNGYIEAFLLIFDLIAVLTLLCGVSKKQSGLLKPYLFYNTLWSFGLILLFVIFIWHMIRGNQDISKNILDNLKSLHVNSDEYYYRSHYTSTAAIFATIGVMFAMFLVIIIDCVFLHIVYKTFQFFAYREDKKREELDKKERI